MGNRITRTVLFAASALLSVSAFGAGAARLGTLRNADWVVTNAWQAVSNKTHDLIIDMGQEASLPPNWLNVSNAAMSAVQSLQPAYDYSDSAIQNFSSTNSVLSGGPYLKTSYEGATVGYSYSPGGEIVFNPSGIYVDGYSYLTHVAIISEETNGPLSSIQQYGGRFITARQEMENYISTNNQAFVSAVLAAPLVGADPSDLSELAEYGSYGTVGAAILALIAGLAALKRRMTAAETAIEEKPDFSDLSYALIVPGEWRFSEMPSFVTIEADPVYESLDSRWSILVDIEGSGEATLYASGNADDLLVVFDLQQVSQSGEITATRTLPGHLADRAANAIPVLTNTTLTLPAENPGHSRDLYARLTVSATSAVTWAVAQGESWDSAGAPPSSFAAGTYLYRFTEVAPGVFHAADVTNGGSIDPAVLDGKLDASSAAPPFSDSLTYLVGEYVTYGGALYRCKTAVVTAGAWTGTSNWEAVDMTSPDATLDIRSDGRLEVVSASGETLWIQGYDMSSASSVSLSCERVNLYAFTAAPAFDATTAYAANDIVAYDGVVYVFTSAHSAGAWTGSDASVYAVSLEMPTAPSGKVGDFVLDIDNAANSSASVTATLNGFGTSFDMFTPEGQNLLTDILTFEGGEQCELYFTMTAFGTAAKPAWKVVKQVVEKQEAGS